MTAGSVIRGAALAAGLVLLLGATGVLVVRYRVYHVPGPSMSDSVRPGDRIVADTYAGTVRRGDIVVVDGAGWPAFSAGADRVKRVIGLGGDTVSCCDPDGRLVVNGAPLTETYRPRSVPAADNPFSVRVPPGRVFLLGDNRPVSVDSRSALDDEAGTVPLSEVTAKVVAIAYPAARAGSLTGGLPGAVLAATAGLALVLVAAVANGATRVLARRAGRAR